MQMIHVTRAGRRAWRDGTENLVRGNSTGEGIASMGAGNERSVMEALVGV